jgi:hypothetical protein
VNYPETVACRLEEGSRDRLERLATLGGRTVGEELRLAVREHLIRAYVQKSQQRREPK